MAHHAHQATRETGGRCEACQRRKAKAGRRYCKHCYEQHAAAERADNRHRPRTDGNFIYCW